MSPASGWSQLARPNLAVRECVNDPDEGETMKPGTKIAIGAAATAVCVALLGANLASATGAASIASGSADPEETDTPITGSALAHASEAALAHLGEGTVTGTEVGDEESYYEVEVTLENGREVDVQLDASFTVISSDADVDTDD